MFHVEHRARDGGSTWNLDHVASTASMFHVEHRVVLDPAMSPRQAVRADDARSACPDRKSQPDELSRRGGTAPSEADAVATVSDDAAGASAARRRPSPSRLARRSTVGPAPAPPTTPTRLSTAPAACRSAAAAADHRRGQPEGRRRQDDHDDQRRRLPRRARPAHADHRPRSRRATPRPGSASRTAASRPRCTTC